MIKLINKLAPFVFVLLIGCKNREQETNSVNMGYLQSKPYQKYIASSDDKKRADYSTKRMFMLLEEEEFLYSFQYDYYAIYSIVQKNTIDFYILKSKDSIQCLTHKRLDSAGFFLYLNKDTHEETQRYNLKTNIGLVNRNTIAISSQIIKRIISLEQNGNTIIPDYDDPIQTLFLFDGNEYNLLSNYSLTGMNEIDSLFRKELFTEK